MTALAITETEWQEQVTQLARMLGWEWLHVRRTIGRGRRWTTATNIVGFPDLFLWHPEHGFAALELKSERGKVSDEQLAVLDQLADAGAVTLVARPGDLDLVHRILKGQAR